MAAESEIRLDIARNAGDWPARPDLAGLARRAVQTAYQAAVADGLPARGDYEVSLMFTDNAAMQALNSQWRGKNQPTNVLSFPQTGAAGNLLGDIVLGFETVQDEARLENKPMEHHIAHLIVHGFLHLVGYDHDNPEAAEMMEQLERNGLARIGIADPYAAQAAAAAASVNHDG